MLDVTLARETAVATDVHKLIKLYICSLSKPNYHLVAFCIHAVECEESVPFPVFTATSSVPIAVLM